MMNFTKNLLLKASQILFAKTGLAVIAFMLFGFAAQAQKTITGKVVDENNSPLAGATVSSGNNTTKTLANGVFTMQVPDDAKNVTVSYVGYGTQTTKISFTNTMNISLISTKKSEEEVVVTGYSKIKRGNFAGAATKLSSKVVETVLS